jgi:hypothetical protein
MAKKKKSATKIPEPIRTLDPGEYPKGTPPPPTERILALPSVPIAAPQEARTRIESIKVFFIHLHLALRFIAFGFALGALGFSWTMIDHGEFFAAYTLLVAAVLFALIAIYGWEGLKHFPRTTKIFKSIIFLGICLVAGYFSLVFRKIQGDKPLTTLWSRPSGGATTTTQPQDDLRSELRADGNRAIRIVTVHLTLKRKYSVAEIGHFRVMYEVAAITNKTIPEFYIACQDYYDVNTFVDPKAKQFGYRWTVRYREPNGTYGPIESFSKGRGYGATTGLVSTTDELEFSADLYNQIPSDKILEDLFGKYLYIFVTESLVDKISKVSLQVNNWELFSVKADSLVSQDDKPIAPWFIALSKDEKAIPWRSVDVRFDEPLPPAVAGRFKGQTPGWTWSLDPTGLHPKKLPEPELKVDPFKRAN